MTDPIIPGLHAAVMAGARALLRREHPYTLWGDLNDLDQLAYRYEAREVLTAAYPHLIAPAIKAAREDMRERCADVCWDHDSHSAIRALPLTDPTA